VKPQRHPRQNTLLTTIFILNLIEFLQSGMIAFGAGPIMGEISASPEQFSLATTVYASFAIGVIAMQRWLIERLGWRAFIQASIAVYLVGAAICAGSADFDQFLAGRAVMGLGGAAFMTSARLMINLLPPSPARLLGIKVFASALFIGNALAPWLASIIIGQERWHAIFVVLGALALLAAILASFCLRTMRVPPARRTLGHPVMVLCMAGGSFLCLFALQRATYDFYAGATPQLLALAVGALALAYFIHHQYGHANPVLVVRRLIQARFFTGIGVFTVCYFVLGANSYMLPALMQRALGFPWIVVGQVQAAGLIVALPAFFLMMHVLRVVPRPKKFFVIGFCALGLFGWHLAHISEQADLWRDVMPAIAGYGIFIALVMSTAAMHTFSGLMHDELAFSHAQQAKNMLSQFGLGLGSACAALGLQWRFAEHYGVLNERFSAGQAAYEQALGQLSTQLNTQLGAPAASAPLALAQLNQMLNQQANLLASLDYFWFIVGLALFGAIVMWLQRVIE